MTENKSIVDDLNIDIEGFSGPLDLLDNLIRDNKLDILNLDISSLSVQYYEYIKNNLDKLEIDKLGSYLVLSTYLLDLKSKKILVALNEDAQTKEDFEYERDKLVSRIIEYRKYKEVCTKLVSKRSKREKMFSKDSNLTKLNESSEKIYYEKMPTYINPQKLLDAILKAYEKYHFSLFSKNNIIVQELSVDEVKKELITFLKQYILKQVTFDQFLVNVDELKISEQYIVTSFLALLELVKYHLVDLHQNNNSNEIFIDVKDLNDNSLYDKGDE